ncbi:MAG TPA: dihydroorotase, partial [Clostridiales bacterium]|nr:dihydroorotase [Clostridiales bacterium]
LALGITYLVKKGYLDIAELLEKMTINPSKLYNLEAGRIKEGAIADLVLFDMNERWTVDNFFSKSSNSPFLGHELQGKVKLTLCGGRIVYNDYQSTINYI